MLVGLSTYAGAQPGNIRYTKHNLSNQSPTTGASGAFVSTRSYNSNQVNQICIFCHTPHNAQPSYPLWNKVLPTQTFKLYTASSTLSSVAKGASLTADSASLLCLSCHDGKTAINVLHNASFVPHGTTAGGKPIVDIMDSYNNNEYGATDPATGGLSMGVFSFIASGYYKANLGASGTDYFDGSNLTDDHPIGFSYSDAASATINSTRLYTVNEVNTNSGGKVRFYPPNNRLECSSCHDPHVSYEDNAPAPTDSKLRPFLVMSNQGSALCLSCHKK